jgi:hypothetical protein
MVKFELYWQLPCVTLACTLMGASGEGQVKVCACSPLIVNFTVAPGMLVVQ